MIDCLDIQGLTHRYGERVALNDLTLKLPAPGFLGLLGPNGSGKTTLFRLLSTLMRVQSGTIRVMGHDVTDSPAALRRELGVVFQAPSLDPHLSVIENLTHHGHLYGLRGRELAGRLDELLGELSLTDRRKDRVSTLSGGLQRRVELARCLVHRPRLLLLDEPTTGLDPQARTEFWNLIDRARTQHEVSVVFTTHWFEEAERCQTLGIMHRGELKALDTPDALKATIDGDVVIIKSREQEAVRRQLQDMGLQPSSSGGSLILESTDGAALLQRLAGTLNGELDSIALAKPTLADVFLKCTGDSLDAPAEEART